MLIDKMIKIVHNLIILRRPVWYKVQPISKHLLLASLCVKFISLPLKRTSFLFHPLPLCLLPPRYPIRDLLLIEFYQFENFSETKRKLWLRLSSAICIHFQQTILKKRPGVAHLNKTDESRLLK